MTETADALSHASFIRRRRRLGHRSDEALCRQVAAGSAEAFEALYERYYHRLYNYCYLILGHAEDAGDALHNTMTKAWLALGRAELTGPLRPWLFRIAHNEAVNVLRKRPAHGDLEEATVVAAGGLDETLETRERLERLRSDLATLTERQRAALLLRELSGLGHSEIAAVLAVSTGAARQTIYEARSAILEAEAGRGMACEAIQRTLSDGDGRVRRGRKVRAHLRTCELCAAFDAGLRARPRDLGALVPPLPAGASLGLLARLLSQAGTSAGISSAVGGGTAAPF